MEQKYYIHHKGQNLGPYAVEEILQKLKGGELEFTDYIFDQAKNDWVAFLDSSMLADGIKNLQTKPKAPPMAKPTEVTQRPEPTKLQIAKLDTPAPTPSADGQGDQEWYVLKWENKYGPFTYVDVIKMLQSKSIFEFDYIWKANFENWKRIAEVEYFNPDNIKSAFKNEKDLEEKNVFFRRRHPRSEFNGSILIHDNTNVWKGSTIEISEGGAGIIMNNAMVVPGQSIYLHFKPGDQVPPFNAVCEVVSKSFVKDVKDRNAPVKYGVKFLKIQPGTKKAIKEFVGQKAS